MSGYRKKIIKLGKGRKDADRNMFNCVWKTANGKVIGQQRLFLITQGHRSFKNESVHQMLSTMNETHIHMHAHAHTQTKTLLLWHFKH